MINKNFINRIATILILITAFLTVLYTSQSFALEMNDTVIRKNTVWDGTITIEGVVVVSREAVLTIKPGTIIEFKKIDRDRDGVGDSEIRILGGLIAEGTSENKIIFRSAESQPTLKDWSYILLFASGIQNRISYCSFSHAFSGLQVHFSTASVNNSVFIDNFEGLRFGRADLSIENNLFTQNDVGIRFTRMEGPALISDNDIRENRIGIFLVPSGQNITDFFAPDRGGIPWNTGRLKISGNNIYNNSGYNLNLGEKQFWDLDISGNFWGNTDAEQIAETIFDQRRDSRLGKAIFTPFLTRINRAAEYSSRKVSKN